MKLLADSPQDVDIRALMSSDTQGDYIYMYPPRQAYSTIDGRTATSVIDKSLEHTQHDPVNLYLHFPFCKQICKFCNLYAVPLGDDSLFDAYVTMLEREMQSWSARIGGRPIDTVYLGGGTPSLLPVDALDRVLRGIEKTFSVDMDSVAEVALEVAPDTVDARKLHDLQGIGINRVNLGLQSATDEEIRSIGRRHGFDRAQRSIVDALEAGFGNVCIDLIYGLPGQSVESWIATLEKVVALSAPTVCAYPLTLRPGTGFGRRGVSIEGHDQYRKYELARDVLRSVGYEQETHVRYVVAGVGGYRQKVNHWAGQDIVGLGAGARGYLHRLDYRNGYSLRRRKSALVTYMEDMTDGRCPIRSGFELDPDERLRKALILGLLNLDRRRVVTHHGVDPVDAFPGIFDELTSLDLAQVDDDRIALTEAGRKFRDLVVQLFFSSDVWKRIKEFDYSE
ncbi:oxygen-independent coproporphyrinogen-3 oxidase [Kribbella steppae]|uniref:Heme chaperone HemW n=1 Tax=Kribbella steppae TaxID=2512223 RepID=A0A4R2GT33_9ACTN|nr:coproporphyrinogen-III oxidase family protein [Kribbella steppae]TCO13512.1 oxygen-independent coproporphyrinogen-3 oxidase [Kribbella steppae]